MWFKKLSLKRNGRAFEEKRLSCGVWAFVLSCDEGFFFLLPFYISHFRPIPAVFHQETADRFFERMSFVVTCSRKPTAARAVEVAEEQVAATLFLVRGKH
jgi:hypothetical protein